MIFGRVLCDFNHEPKDYGEIIKMGHLFKLRANPANSSTNLRLELNSSLVHELNGLDEGSFVVDLTADRSRDLVGLGALSKQLKSRKVICCTGPFVLQNFNELSTLDVLHHLRSELLSGAEIPGAPTAVSLRIGAISVPISSNTLNTLDLKALSCVAQVQVSFLGSTHLPPPLFIEFPHWAQNHSKVLETLLLDCPSLPLSRVVLCHNVLSYRTLDYFRFLLASFPEVTLCIDSFGSVETPLQGPMYPNDEEIIASVISLLHSGHSSQLLLSPHCRYKIHLTTYGGSGYGHLQSFVMQRILATDTSFVVEADEFVLRLPSLMRTSLLSWFVPPEVREPDPEMVDCVVCQKRVRVQEQYEKFDRSYCSSKCITDHRKRNWV
jgi:predicted metal-dependent phosphotriesterase family hydrolase